jgi:hypothetical protein
LFFSLPVPVTLLDAKNNSSSGAVCEPQIEIATIQKQSINEPNLKVTFVVVVQTKTICCHTGTD